MAATEYTTVTLDDGRIVDFPGKRKMQKESIEKADGTLQVRLDFVNGETRLFTILPTMVNRFALHGAEQKLGDEISGLEDIDDCVLAIDNLMELLDKGEWSIRRESNGMAGTSVLARALIEFTGKPAAEIKAFLATKTQAQKVALRDIPKIAPIVQRLEAAKKKKAPAVDTDALLSELA